MAGSNPPPCQSQRSQCSNPQISSIEPIMKYYGALLIVKKYQYVTLKISILVVLSVIIIPLLVVVMVLFWRCHSVKHSRHSGTTESIDKCPPHEKPNDPEVSFANPRKRSSNPDYHSLTLVDNADKKSSAKIYSEPRVMTSLKRLVENCDKSIFLHAGYLNSAVAATDQSQCQSLLATTNQPMTSSAVGSKKLRVHSHSAMELSFTEPTTVTNWVINSWPLSTAERRVKCQKQQSYNNNCRSARGQHCQSSRQGNVGGNNHSSNNHNNSHNNNNNNGSWQQNTNSSGSSSKQKISYTFNSEPKSVSNPKVSSNRTTFSESISANDMTTKSSSKWWSLLTNYWMNQNFVMSRN